MPYSMISVMEKEKSRGDKKPHQTEDQCARLPALLLSTW